MSLSLDIKEAQSYNKGLLPVKKFNRKGPTLEGRQDLEPFKDAEGKFRCTKCSRSYIHFKHLKRHNRKHTGYRPHVCPLCRDSFCRSDIMKRHYDRCYNKLTTTGKCSTISRVPKKLDPNHESERQQFPQNQDHQNQQQLPTSQYQQVHCLDSAQVDLEGHILTGSPLTMIDTSKLGSSPSNSARITMIYPPLYFNETTIANNIVANSSLTNNSIDYCALPSRFSPKYLEYGAAAFVLETGAQVAQQQPLVGYSEDVRISDYQESSCSNYSNSSSENYLLPPGAASCGATPMLNADLPLNANRRLQPMNENMSNESTQIYGLSVGTETQVNLSAFSGSSWQF
jgi:hypothetical protein